MVFQIHGFNSTILAKFVDSIPRFWQKFVDCIQCYCHLWCNRYFWRTHEQKEIDYVEDRDGQLSAFEFKYSPKKKVVVPKHFAEASPTATFKVITPDNFEEFVLNG